jgi:PAT family beta-lactamase induction signal transducer AmpG
MTSHYARLQHFTKTYLNQRLITVLLLGFASGFPIALTTTALQAWYTVSDVSITVIGFLGLLGQPYVYKFLWAPVLDRFVIPLLGRRRGWILCMQIGIMAVIFLMSLQNPRYTPWLLASTGLLLALFSATQDIGINAYSTEVLHPEERGLGAAFSIGGYRIAMLVSGSISLIMADRIGWQFTYQCMAVIMLIGIVGTLFAPEPKEPTHQPATLLHAISEPLKEFFSRDAAVAILLLVILYKLGDAFAISLSTTFLIRGLGFSQTDVGVVMKGIGLFASLLGVFVGGSLMMRIGLYASLFWFGILQAVSNLMFMVLAIVGKNTLLMIAVVFIEQGCSGLGTAAFFAFLMSLCDKRYTATQFALLSALAAIGRVYVGPIAGIMVAHIGWVQFYWWSFIVGLPGLVLLRMLRTQVTNATQTREV